MDDCKTTAALHKKKVLQQLINYRKVDAPLAAAVEEIENAEDPTLAIFIYTARSRDDAATIFLHTMGKSTAVCTNKISDCFYAPLV